MQKTAVPLFFRCLVAVSTLIILASTVRAQDNDYVKTHYIKKDVRIPMRDGVKLYTVIYIPKDSTENHPILMERTPYSAGPYGEDKYARRIGPNTSLMKEKYIFVYQDVRGRYMSEGNFREMTPNDPTHKSPDESSDAFDTIEWLLANLTHHNGKVGLYGISYPGFYATASLPDAHPAIKAVSPQAPVTDEFMGDDANHKGAFFLMDNFGFMSYFDAPRTGPIEDYGSSIVTERYKDAYAFFLQLGPLKNTLKPEYYGKTNGIFKEYLAHDTYDEYWKARNIRAHLKNVKPATLIVGGLFDPEDLFGALETYKAIEQQNPVNKNTIVMGPWTHGAWARGNWEKYAGQNFGMNTSKYFQDSLETPFFNYYLKDKGNFSMPEAVMFETGSNQWRKYDVWPAKNVRTTSFYLLPKHKLSEKKKGKVFSEYVSDPANPVPYTAATMSGRNNEYMAEDQRFASKRNDVLWFQTDTLKAPLTVAGKVTADLQVSMTGSDADFIVKLIDVLPDGTQRLVRAEVMRGKFRNSFEQPEAFVPGKVSSVRFELPDASHQFLPGHRLMVQIQSSWFPLVDRNPQRFMRIAEADEMDYQKQTIRVYGTSKIELETL
jgi:putative CocE/NonD family hydrolase